MVIPNRIYQPGEIISFENDFKRLAEGKVLQDCKKFICIRIQKIQKNGKFVPIENYNTTIWKDWASNNTKGR